ALVAQLVELGHRAELLRARDGRGQLAVDRVRQDLLAFGIVARQPSDDVVEGALAVEHHRPQLTLAVHPLRLEQLALDLCRLARQALQAERRRKARRRIDRDYGHLLAARGQAERDRRRRRRLADAAGAEADAHALALEALVQAIRAYASAGAAPRPVALGLGAARGHVRIVVA